jgi:hypothetical protein
MTPPAERAPESVARETGAPASARAQPRWREPGGTRDAAAWLAVYVLAVTVPLFALLPGPAARRGFLWDFAMALGYAGLAMLGVLFALTARFRRATAPFGIDFTASQSQPTRCRRDHPHSG